MIHKKEEKKMLWTYLIHLGSNMWGDRNTRRTTRYFSCEPCYQETMLTDRAVWRKVVDFAAAQGINTLLIDLVLQSEDCILLPGCPDTCR